MNLKKKFILIAKNILVKKLVFGKSKNCGGRSFTGKIVVRGRGYLKKFKKRVINNFNLFFGLNIVLSFEYDPGRNTLIYLLLSKLGCAFYSIAVEKICVGNIICIGLNIPKVSGNVTIVKKLKRSSIICNLQKNIKKKSSYLKASGMYGKLVKKNKLFCTVKVKTYNRFLKIGAYSWVTIGSIMKFNYYLHRHKNAGLFRLFGFRPKVRGVAMNPVDHPFGGGEGKKSKKSISMSPWGKLIKGKKTKKFNAR